MENQDKQIIAAYMDTQPINMDVELEPITSTAKINKLRALIASANHMSKMKSFPDTVRKTFLNKAKLYERQLRELENKQA